ncbi:MAG: DUF1552 domain-containing protein [Verrucomicrobiota bacterium]
MMNQSLTKASHPEKKTSDDEALGMPHIRKVMDRRSLLRASGVAIGLPFLEAMRSSVYAADKVAAASASPRRMVILMNSLSLLPQHFFPKTAGYNYETTPYMDLRSAHRKRMTVMSGVSLPGVDSGHGALPCFLTGAAHPGRPGFRNTVSLDILAAEAMGHHTRFPFLPIMISPSNGGAESGEPMSFTSAGVPIPGETSGARLFKKMFLQGNKAEVQAQIVRLQEERSILDMMVGRVKKLKANVSSDDREKLDQYFTSVRELEQRLVAVQAWERKPKPKVDAPIPEDITTFTDGIKQHRVIFDVMKLALSTDSTRIISLGIHMGSTRQEIDGIHDGTHPLSHHGHDPEKMEQLRVIEELQLKEIAMFLDGLQSVKEQRGSLLDNTMVMFGSNMGSANAHSNVNLPTFLVGGGFKHGQHLAFDKKNNYPLTNLYVSMLQRMGIEADRFSSSTGTMRGLDMV